MRKITANTTDEQIMSAAVAARKSLAEAALEATTAEYQMGEALVKAAQNVRSAEAIIRPAMVYRDLLAAGASKEKKMGFLFNLLSNGADDSWSGRMNDSNRMCHDAVRAFADRMMDDIRYSG